MNVEQPSTLRVPAHAASRHFTACPSVREDAAAAARRRHARRSLEPQEPPAIARTEAVRRRMDHYRRIRARTARLLDDPQKSPVTRVRFRCQYEGVRHMFLRRATQGRHRSCYFRIFFVAGQCHLHQRQRLDDRVERLGPLTVVVEHHRERGSTLQRARQERRLREWVATLIAIEWYIRALRHRRLAREPRPVLVAVSARVRTSQQLSRPAQGPSTGYPTGCPQCRAAASTSSHGVMRAPAAVTAAAARRRAARWLARSGTGCPRGAACGMRPSPVIPGACSPRDSRSAGARNRKSIRGSS